MPERTEEQAFLRSYDSAPRPPPPLPPVSKLDRRHTEIKSEKRGNLRTGERGEGGGRGAQSYDQKAWSSINHSILSAAS
jgi:hypothetical protein